MGVIKMPETFATDVMLLIAFMGGFAFLLAICELVFIGLRKIRRWLYIKTTEQRNDYRS